MFDLHGKNALITGSSQGIGLAIARCLAEHGAAVYVNGSDADKAARAAAGIPGAAAVACDLLERDCAETLYRLTGDVDILVLNASIQYRRPWLEITDDDFDRQMTVNFLASLKLIQRYAPSMMRRRWGRILTVGSIQQQKPHKDMLIYAASKAAQENMARNLAKQLAPFGITVNNLAPGVILTPRNAEALSDADYARQVMDRIACGHAGDTDDCAAQALVLCSEEGRYITGENIFVDGGMKL